MKHILLGTLPNHMKRKLSKVAIALLLTSSFALSPTVAQADNQHRSPTPTPAPTSTITPSPTPTSTITPSPTPTSTPVGDRGNGNTAIGTESLLSLTTGTYNAAMGYQALSANTIGNSNIALGASAGINLTTGDNNIDIGNHGVAGESGTIRIGDPTIHTATFMAGITAMSPSAPIQAVLVDPATGQLGRTDIASFPPGPQGPQGLQGDQGLLDRLARKAHRGSKELLDHKVFQVQLVCRVHRVRVAIRALLGPQDRRAHRVQLVPKVHRVLRDQWGRPALGW